MVCKYVRQGATARGILEQRRCLLAEILSNFCQTANMAKNLIPTWSTKKWDTEKRTAEIFILMLGIGLLSKYTPVSPTLCSYSLRGKIQIGVYCKWDTRALYGKHKHTHTYIHTHTHTHTPGGKHWALQTKDPESKSWLPLAFAHPFLECIQRIQWRWMKWRK